MMNKRMYYVLCSQENCVVYTCRLSQDSLSFMLKRLPVVFPDCHIVVSRDKKGGNL